MIRKATERDIQRVTEIYERTINAKDAASTVGWISGVYPTRETAEEALKKGTLFVLESDGEVTATAKIDDEQVYEYRFADWKFKDIPDDKILVLHTLAVDPLYKGRGAGTEFVKFYEEYAKNLGRLYLRMDTNATNLPARAFYKKRGYREAGIVRCDFHGIKGVNLICLEKSLVGE